MIEQSNTEFSPEALAALREEALGLSLEELARQIMGGFGLKLVCERYAR